MNNSIISVSNLTKIYKKYGKTPFPSKFKALHDISFEVHDNEIYGFLGKNGAGKTTTIKILMQLIPYNRGNISILGKKMPDLNIHMELGYLPELPYFYEFLTLKEMLSLYGDLFDVPKNMLRERIEYLIDLVGLNGHENVRMGEFSKGMLQRSGLAQALINDPRMLILDEPLSGLDPVGRKELRDIIITQKKLGKTVLFSSHILQDAEMICDRIAIVKDGVVITQGSIRELLPPSDNIFEIHLVNLDDSEIDIIKGIDIFEITFTDNYGNLALRTKEVLTMDEILSSQIRGMKDKIIRISKNTPSLEDIFIEKNRAGEYES